MTVFNENSLSDLRTRDCVQWLQSRMENKQSHHIQDLYERRLVAAEMVAAEVYHALVWFLQAYPSITSVKPVWVPTIDNDDRSLIVRFRLDLESQDPQDLEDRERRTQQASSSGDPLDALYGYDDPPPSIAEAGSAVYDTLVELCEGVGPEIWNEFTPYSVAEAKRKPYTSVEQVEADMQEDLSHFLPHLQQWLLERPTQPAQEQPRSPKQRL